MSHAAAGWARSSRAGAARRAACRRNSAANAARFTHFVQQHARVHVDVLLTNRRVHLVEEGVDLALRAGALDDSTLMARKVGESELGLYASPGYLSRRGQPRTLAQLARHDCVLFRSNAGLVPWRLTGPRGVEEAKVSGRVTLDGLAAVREAIDAGLGIGLQPVARLPGEGAGAALVRVLPRYALRGGAVHLVWSGPAPASCPATWRCSATSWRPSWARPSKETEKKSPKICDPGRPAF